MKLLLFYPQHVNKLAGNIINSLECVFLFLFPFLFLFLFLFQVLFPFFFFVKKGKFVFESHPIVLGLKMKGIVCTKLSKSFEDGVNCLEIVDLPREEVGGGCVRVEVRAVALNFFDLLMLVGKYQMKVRFLFFVFLFFVFCFLFVIG